MNPRRQLAVLAILWLASCGTAHAGIIHHNFNFSSTGSGSFDYDDASRSINALVFDFGAFGDMSPMNLGAFLTPLVFGAPPGATVAREHTFFALSGGSAHSLRLSSDGSWCVRPNAARCGARDLASGTYRIAPAAPPDVIAVAEPDMLMLFGLGLLALGAVRLRAGGSRP